MKNNPDQADFLRDDGIARAVAAANRKRSGWADDAYEALYEYVNGQDKAFLAEEVRDWAESNGLDIPPSKRAWGAIFVKAKNAGIIRACGFRATSNPRAHRTPATLWIRGK